MILKQFNLENIKITFKVDGIETSVVGEKDKTLLDSAIDNDIDAPYSCRGGACATCIGKIKNGKVELEQNYNLTDSELEDGLILTCTYNQQQFSDRMVLPYIHHTKPICPYRVNLPPLSILGHQRFIIFCFYLKGLYIHLGFYSLHKKSSYRVVSQEK